MNNWMVGLSRVATNVYAYKAYQIIRLRPRGYDNKCTFSVYKEGENPREGTFFDNINKAKKFIDNLD